MVLTIKIQPNESKDPENRNLRPVISNGQVVTLSYLNFWYYTFQIPFHIKYDEKERIFHAQRHPIQRVICGILTLSQIVQTVLTWIYYNGLARSSKFAYATKWSTGTTYITRVGSLFWLLKNYLGIYFVWTSEKQFLKLVEMIQLRKPNLGRPKRKYYHLTWAFIVLTIFAHDHLKRYARLDWIWNTKVFIDLHRDLSFHGQLNLSVPASLDAFLIGYTIILNIIIAHMEVAMSTLSFCLVLIVLINVRDFEKEMENMSLEQTMEEYDRMKLLMAQINKLLSIPALTTGIMTLPRSIYNFRFLIMPRNLYEFVTAFYFVNKVFAFLVFACYKEDIVMQTIDNWVTSKKFDWKKHHFSKDQILYELQQRKFSFTIWNFIILNKTFLSGVIVTVLTLAVVVIQFEVTK